jgi:hypothetical protein
VDPSSLIFLAIIAMWAAYLLGHWVRRRDQLATARSIDRFSQSMRVLERRTPTRPVGAARPTARAYVVAPVRAPLVARSGAAGRRPLTDPRAAAVRDSHRNPGVSGAASGSTSGHGTGRITREAARRRTRLLLALAVATVTGWLLVATTALVWWPAVLVSAVLAAVLVQLRRTARRARPRTSRRRGAVRRSLASRVPVPARRPRHHQDVRAVIEQVAAARRVSNGAVVATPESFATTPDAGGQPPLSAPTDAGATGRPEPRPVADGWQPVPVPPPTYTLKPKARPVVRRAVAPQLDAADVPTATGPLSAQVDGPAAPAFDLDEILERRIAAGG